MDGIWCFVGTSAGIFPVLRHASLNYCLHPRDEQDANLVGRCVQVEADSDDMSIASDAREALYREHRSASHEHTVAADRLYMRGRVASCVTSFDGEQCYTVEFEVSMHSTLSAVHIFQVAVRVCLHSNYAVSFNKTFFGTILYELTQCCSVRASVSSGWPCA